MYQPSLAWYRPSWNPKMNQIIESGLVYFWTHQIVVGDKYQTEWGA